MKIFLQDVFKKSGIPTYTFVKPTEYNKIIVSLRTNGRGLIIEGPSGIGKTTGIEKALEELGLNKNVCKLSARKKDDRELIQMLPTWKGIGTVILDDFHVLTEDLKSTLADYMKVLADEERVSDKLILIGINKAGDSLIKLAADLNNRVDTIKFERNPDSKIEELITKGEEILKVEFNEKSELIVLSKGSFHIAQYLCNELCTYDGILENKDMPTPIKVSLSVIKEKVLEELGRTFYSKARAFAIGSKLRREGRAPYLHLLYWLSLSDNWTIQIEDITRAHPELKISILQIVDKGYLQALIRNNEELQDVIHYDSNSRILTIEDPKFIFYIQNLLWSKFARQVGYLSILFKSKYDFALSFAGENRVLAEKINSLLTESDIAVFYDKNEQHRILADNVEDYLSPIYSTEARFVIALLSNSYPKKIWTKFESDNFKQRFGDKAIIPIWFSDCTPGLFDESRKYGGFTYEIGQDFDTQAQEIVNQLVRRLTEERVEELNVEKSGVE
jgi:hypothetical protein